MAKKQTYENISKKGNYTLDDLDCALDCLIEANEISEDKELLKLVKAHAKKKAGQIKSIKDIRDLSNSLYDEEPDDKKSKD